MEVRRRKVVRKLKVIKKLIVKLKILLKNELTNDERNSQKSKTNCWNLLDKQDDSE